MNLLLLFIGVYLQCHLAIVGGSLSDITDKVFPEEAGDVLAAFGDFNADKLTDIFVISKEGQSVDLFLARDDAKSFTRKTLIKQNEAHKSFNITSVMPGDFNGDVQMDVLITRIPLDSNEEDAITVEVYWGSGGNGVESTPLTFPEKMRDQPLLFDWNADMLPDLLCETEGGRVVWQANDKEKNFTKIEIKTPEDLDPLPKFAKPTSNSFLDLNGDNTADLMIVSTDKDENIQFEIWLNKDGNLTYDHKIPGPLDSKSKKPYPFIEHCQASFFDLDMDGEIELVLPVCADKTCNHSLVLVYNNVMKQNEKWQIMVDDFTAGTIRWGFVPPKEASALSRTGQQFPITLRAGDYNMNGYPDAVVILRDLSDKDANPQAFVLKNEECNTDICSGVGRTFVQEHDSALIKTKGVVLVALFDIYEDGILDILVTEAVGGKNATTRLLAFSNDLRADACFLKITVVSGLCGSSCPDGRKPYGVNQPGPSIKYKTTRTDGKKQESCDSQFTKSAHFSLQLPFVIFGLGQTPNFVETVTVGLQQPTTPPRRQHSWPQLIPNSQLIVIPHPLNNPDKWSLKLFVTPSHLGYITGAVLVGTCGFIAGIVGILHWREKREDKKEKMQDAQKFHFDAM